jgi:hypothetical protein
MKRLMIMVVGLGLAAAVQGVAQGTKEAGTGDRPPPRNESSAGDQETLTDAQIEQVKTILSNYAAASLTAADAKAIHEAFREAGLRAGKALNDAVTAAGFDPDKLRDLDPPPNREGGGARGGDDRRGPAGQEPREQGQTNGN